MAQDSIPKPIIISPLLKSKFTNISRLALVIIKTTPIKEQVAPNIWKVFIFSIFKIDDTKSNTAPVHPPSPPQPACRPEAVHAGLSAGSKESGRVHGGIDFRRELHLALAPVGVRGRGRGRNPC